MSTIPGHCADSRIVTDEDSLEEAMDELGDTARTALQQLEGTGAVITIAVCVDRSGVAPDADGPLMMEAPAAIQLDDPDVEY